MSVKSRIKRIEQKLRVRWNDNIQNSCTFTILGPPEGTPQTEAETAEREAGIERAKQEAIRQNPKHPFLFLIGYKDNKMDKTGQLKATKL